MTLEERGFRRTLRLSGRDLVILRAAGGVRFRATINRIGEFGLTTDLGDDPRGNRIMELLKAGAPGFRAQDILQDEGNSEKFRIVATKFECPEYALRFELEQLTDQDQ